MLDSKRGGQSMNAIESEAVSFQQENPSNICGQAENHFLSSVIVMLYKMYRCWGWCFAIMAKFCKSC